MVLFLKAIGDWVIKLYQVLKRPAYFVLGFLLVGIAVELMFGSFWLKLYEWIFEEGTFKDLFDLELTKDPMELGIGFVFLVLGIGVISYFEKLRIKNPDEKPIKKELTKDQQTIIDDIRRNANPSAKPLKSSLDLMLLDKACSSQSIQRYEALCLHALSQWLLKDDDIDTHFSRLNVYIDHGKNNPEGQFIKTHEYDHLKTLIEDQPFSQKNAFVLLGRPGCGKSTLLRNLQYEIGLEYLTKTALPKKKRQTSHRLPIPFFVKLNEYPSSNQYDKTIPAPMAWLEQRWQSQYPNLPPLASVMDEQPIVFLLDALNEMRCANLDEYENLVVQWRSFIRELSDCHRQCRVIFSCRSMNYGKYLSSEDHDVPQIDFAEMSDKKIQGYLNKTLR